MPTLYMLRKPHPHVAWTRYWVPLGTNPTLDTDGFLVEPNYKSEHMRAPVRVANVDARTYAELASIPCLVLLGEPGAGKTTEMAHFAEPNAVRIDLGAVGGEGGFAEALTKHSDLQAWKADGAPLTLLVDAYDEALLRVNAAARLLSMAITEGLPEDPNERRQRAGVLRLRVTSRGGVWPESVTRSFQSLWGESAVGVYTLAPLRRQDVSLATHVLGARDGFVSAVVEAEAGSWAALPLSLFWLVKLYEQDGALPDTRRELFVRGALLLCEESNEGRLEADHHGLLNPAQRLALAGRVAALMRFGDRAVLSLRGPDDHPEGALRGPEAEGREVSTTRAPFTVGPEELRDLARHTALFRAAGTGLYRWTQETTGDFLAAWYLDHRGVGAVQALSLVTDPEDGQVVPQLLEVAAWVASFNSDAFLRLADQNPNVALGGDPQALPSAARRQGVERYLDAISTGQLDTFTDPSPRSYKGLQHVGLADQLRPWIVEPSRDAEARAQAVRIAIHTRLAELVPHILSLALDPDAPVDLRVSSVYAVRWLAEPDELAALLPLALSEAPGEDADRLRAAARSAAWPGVLSFEQLVASVSWSTDDDRVLERLVPDRTFEDEALQDSVIAEALGWIAAGRAAEAPSIAGSAILAAAGRAGSPEIGICLAPLLVRLATRDEELLALRVDEHAVRNALAVALGDRAAFLGALVEALLNDEKASTVHRLNSAFRPVRPSDVEWIVDRLLREASDVTRDVCEGLLRPLVSQPDPADLATLAAVLRAAAPRSSRVQNIVRDYYDSWSLDDQWVREVRDNWIPKPKPADPLTPSTVDRLDAAIAMPVEERWGQVCYALKLSPENNTTYHGSGDIEPDVKALPGWAVLNPAWRARVIKAAQEYIGSTSPGEDDWAAAEPKERTWTWRVLDGVRALSLLHRESVSVPDAVWAAWAPALLMRAVDGSVERADAHRTLVVKAAQADRDGFRVHFARAASLGGRRLSALARAVAPLEDGALDSVLLTALGNEEADGHTRQDVLRGLLDRGTPGAEAEVLRLAAEAEDPRVAAMWALLHLRAVPDRAWEAYGARVRSDDAFARALLSHIADRSGQPALPVGAPDEALVTLERRLHVLFLPSKDPERPKGIYSPSTADHLRDLRGGFAAVLASKGTAGSVDAVECLRDVLPERTASYQTKRARARRREASHRALTPADFLALVENQDARLVRSAPELFAVTVETLGGFQDWLRTGEAPRVFDLWNQVPRAEALRLAAAIVRSERAGDPLAESLNSLRKASRKNPSFAFPKDEDALADLALRFLRARLGPFGVVVAREVEVQRGHATDLHVTIPAADEAPQATVVVEVKASWHPHLYASLQSQLADGYLDGVTRRHGVYLVGWFGPDNWYRPSASALHPKADRARRGGIVPLQTKLMTKASEVSTDDRYISVVVADASLPSPRASA